MNIKNITLIVGILILLKSALIYSELNSYDIDSNFPLVMVCIDEGYNHYGLKQNYQICLRSDGSYLESTTSAVSEDFKEEKRDSLINLLSQKVSQ